MEILKGLRNHTQRCGMQTLCCSLDNYTNIKNSWSQWSPPLPSQTFIYPLLHYPHTPLLTSQPSPSTFPLSHNHSPHHTPHLPPSSLSTSHITTLLTTPLTFDNFSLTTELHLWRGSRTATTWALRGLSTTVSALRHCKYMKTSQKCHEIVIIMVTGYLLSLLRFMGASLVLLSHLM